MCLSTLQLLLPVAVFGEVAGTSNTEDVVAVPEVANIAGYACVAGITVVIATVLYCWVSQTIRRPQPPGPKGHFLLGNLLPLTADFDRTVEHLLQWSKQFPHIYTLNLAGQYVVVVHSVEAIRECVITRSTDFSNRPRIPRLEIACRGHLDIVGSNNTPQWASLKKHVMHALKLTGDDLGYIEEVTLDNIQDAITAVESHPPDEAFNFLPVIHSTMAAIVTSMIFGDKVPHNKLCELLEIEQTTRHHLNPRGPGIEIDVLPWLQHVTWWPNVKRLTDVTQVMWTWVHDVTEHMQSTSPHIDAGAVHYMQKVLPTISKPEKLPGDLTLLVINLVMTGTITTSTTLDAAFYMLVARPEVQQQLQQEIDEVIGSATPSLAHKKSCHRIESFIMETLRFISHLPISIPHEAVKESQLVGYKIPKGTQIWVDLFSMHHDPALWDDPYTFIADRFLSPDGVLVAVDHPLRKQLLPFGAGRRVCAGETLAKNRMFLFVCVMLQRFHFTADNSKPLPEYDPIKFKAGVISTPPRYKLKVTRRT